MKILVCGAGQVGEQIARRLSDEGHTVTIIDQEASLVRRVTDKLDVGGIVGHASHPDVQERAGAEDADMMIAVTQLDEVNMVACQVAHTEFNVPQKIARIRAQSYLATRWSDLFRRDHMPIDVIISPEAEVARVALDRLAIPAASDMAAFLDEEVTVAAITLGDDCAVLDTPLRQLTELFSTLDAIVLGLRRDDVLRAATAEDHLEVNDQIYVLSTKKDITRTMSIFGGDRPPAHSIVIVGGGFVGLTVAQMLEDTVRDARVRIIEHNRERAEFIADRLDRTVVLHGDGLEPELLEEAGVASADAAIALTEDDKVNLLTMALCKKAGAAQTIALTNNPVFSNMTGSLGVDTVINPRAATASTVLRHIRRGRVRLVHSIGEGEAEIIEVQVLSTSSVAGKRIRDAKFPDGAVVGAILSGDKVVLPTGDVIIKEEDRVVIFAESSVVKQIEQLFRVSVDFF